MKARGAVWLPASTAEQTPLDDLSFPVSAALTPFMASAWLEVSIPYVTRRSSSSPFVATATSSKAQVAPAPRRSSAMVALMRLEQRPSAMVNPAAGRCVKNTWNVPPA